MLPVQALPLSPAGTTAIGFEHAAGARAGSGRRVRVRCTDQDQAGLTYAREGQTAGDPAEQAGNEGLA